MTTIFSQYIQPRKHIINFTFIIQKKNLMSITWYNFIPFRFLLVNEFRQLFDSSLTFLLKITNINSFINVSLCKGAWMMKTKLTHTHSTHTRTTNYKHTQITEKGEEKNRRNFILRWTLSLYQRSYTHFAVQQRNKWLDVFSNKNF